MSRRFVPNLILGVPLMLVAICTSVCLYVKWEAHQTKRNAEILLLELRRMKVGDSTLADIQRLAAGSQSRFLAKGTDPFCQGTFCTYAFDYYTGLLGRLALWHLHPWRLFLTPAPVGFDATLIVQRDRLVRVEMLLTSDVIPCTVATSVDDEVPELSPVPQAYVYSAQSSHISIYLKPTATAAQRNGAYSFNLDCMDKMGGCRHAAELLKAGPS
jgi:hypothetical protein